MLPEGHLPSGLQTARPGPHTAFPRALAFHFLMFRNFPRELPGGSIARTRVVTRRTPVSPFPPIPEQADAHDDIENIEVRQVIAEEQLEKHAHEQHRKARDGQNISQPHGE